MLEYLDMLKWIGIWVCVLSMTCMAAVSELTFVATILYAEGSVCVQRPDSRIWHGNMSKKQLFYGDKIRTKSNSHAEVMFEDGQILFVGPNTIVQVKGKGEASVRENNQLWFWPFAKL